jgi:hypothetical protein
MTSKYLRQPKSVPEISQAKYELYNLKDNPFPASPFVNPDSDDDRVNGEIYEPSIRQSEYQAILENFITVPQSDPNHLRLGYIMDTSYIGRGNGKSAFLVNLQREINHDFGLSLSNGQNKCFGLVLRPQGSGAVKTFDQFLDVLINGILEADLINDCLVSLRLKSLIDLDPNFDPDSIFDSEMQMREAINSENWYRDNNINYSDVHRNITSNTYLQTTSASFPIHFTSRLFADVYTQDQFAEYYLSLKKGQAKWDFVFSDLVSLFLAADFNGAYIFVDDFERVPDFQSGRQKQDFATALRTSLFDGPYINARIGFYNILLILHAGVPALIQQAWEQSGLEHRAPITYKGEVKNLIKFEKISLDDTFALITRYLDAYRIVEPSTTSEKLQPFMENAIKAMAEQSEFNCTRFLKIAHEILDRGANDLQETIDKEFVRQQEDFSVEHKKPSGIHDAPTKNLLDEAN